MLNRQVSYGSAQRHLLGREAVDSRRHKVRPAQGHRELGEPLGGPLGRPAGRRRPTRGGPAHALRRRQLGVNTPPQARGGVEHPTQGGGRSHDDNIIVERPHHHRRVVGSQPLQHQPHGGCVQERPERVALLGAPLGAQPPPRRWGRRSIGG